MRNQLKWVSKTREIFGRYDFTIIETLATSQDIRMRNLTLWRILATVRSWVKIQMTTINTTIDVRVIDLRSFLSWKNLESSKMIFNRKVYQAAVFLFFFFSSLFFSVLDSNQLTKRLDLHITVVFFFHNRIIFCSISDSLYRSASSSK